MKDFARLAGLEAIRQATTKESDKVIITKINFRAAFDELKKHKHPSKKSNN